jgi:hypothetical protein
MTKENRKIQIFLIASLALNILIGIALITILSGTEVAGATPDINVVKVSNIDNSATIEAVETANVAQSLVNEDLTIDSLVSYYRCDSDFDADGMVKVNGVLYTDSRFRVVANYCYSGSTVIYSDTANSETDPWDEYGYSYDGEITSSVECWEIPELDNQSNCGVGYKYKIIDESTLWLDVAGETMVFNRVW